MLYKKEWNDRLRTLILDFDDNFKAFPFPFPFSFLVIEKWLLLYVYVCH